MSRRLQAITFFAGLCLGFLMYPALSTDHSKKRVTSEPVHISSLPMVGVSHNPEISKQILASYDELPHVTQIAQAYLKPGQVASENWYV